MLVTDSRMQPEPFLGRMLQSNRISLKQLQQPLAGPESGRMGGCCVGEQQQRPSNAMFTEVRNINNTQYAPPVVSGRSRCVYTGTHTNAVSAAGAGYCSAQDSCSQAAVNTDKYSMGPVLPTAVRELGQAQCFPPSCERPGVFSAAWGARVLLLHQEKFEGSDSQPGAFLTANSPLRALPSRPAAGHRGSG